MILTFVSQNLYYGGLRGVDGVAADRWPELVERIKSGGDADFVLLQEAWGWKDYGYRQVARAKNDLKLDALPVPHSLCENPPVLLYNPSTVGTWQYWDDKYTDLFNHGAGFAAFDVGLKNLLTVSSVHLDAFGVDRALQEIEVLIARVYRNGPFAVIGGDLNYTSSRSPDPDYTGIPPYNVALRTKLDSKPNEPLKPDRRIGQKLERAGFVDVAQYMFDKTSDEKYQTPTANHPIDRIDQFWVTEQLAAGIINYQILDTPESASDHKGIAFQIDTDLIDNSSSWQYN